MSYPKSMTFALSRMMGVSKNTIKRNAETTSAVSGGSSIQMKLPVNTYLDWASAFFYTNATTPAGAILPRDTTSLIESRSISAGGVALEQPCQRSAVYHNAVADYVGWNQTTLKSVLQNGGVKPTPTITLATAGASPQTLITGSTAVPIGASVPANTGGAGQLIAIPLGGDSHGLMSSSSTKIIPGQVLPEVLITLQLAGNGVLISTDGTTAVTGNYTFNASYYTIDAYSFNDGFYDELIQAKVNSEEGLEINFYQLSCFQGPANQAPTTSIAQISTQSLNMVFGTLIPTGGWNNFNSQTTNGNSLDTVTYQCQALTRDGSGLGSTGTTQVLVNSIPYTLQALQPGEVFVESCKALSLNNQIMVQSHPNLNTLSNFQSHFFGYFLRFALESDEGSAYMSGLSTLGANGNIQLVFTPSGNAITAGVAAAGNNFQQLIFTHTTKTLQVGAYKQLNVIY